MGDAFADNPKAWNGDHAASDRPETPGMLLADARLKVKDPDIRDLANTILTRFGVEAEGSGRTLL